MPDIPRRSLAAGAGLLIGAMAVRASAQQIAAATAPKFRVQPLTFNPEKIKGLSAKLIASHHDNNYAGAVNRLNAISEQLAKLDFAEAPPFVVNGLKREEHMAYNSTILHELYFECLGEAPTRPSGVFAEALARDFGSLDRWKAEFAATGKALGGGSGWVLLAYSPHDKRLINTWAADHTMTLAGGRPILALDMYEHAYQMDYGARAAAYVDAVLQAIRWDNAAQLYERYSKQA